jgi:osmotically inducible lipoprotein OsmB
MSARENHYDALIQAPNCATRRGASPSLVMAHEMLTTFRRGGTSMNKPSGKILLAIVAPFLLAACAGAPLSTREEGTLGGGALGAGAGAIVGSAVGSPGAGAAIGGGLGLLGGYAVGNEMQNNQTANAYNQSAVAQQQQEIEQQRQEIQRLKTQNETE